MIIKNGEKNLKKNIKNCISVGENFKKYKIIIYENNSTDNTKNILKEFKNKELFEIISEILTLFQIVNFGLIKK